METKIKRLYKGWILDLRDNNVEKCIKNNENYKVILEDKNQIMTLTPEQLSNQQMKKTGPFTSLFKGKYYLISYRWNPDRQ